MPWLSLPRPRALQIASGVITARGSRKLGLGEYGTRHPTSSHSGLGSQCIRPMRFTHSCRLVAYPHSGDLRLVGKDGILLGRRKISLPLIGRFSDAGDSTSMTLHCNACGIAAITIHYKKEGSCTVGTMK